jgi:hypothetical protein
LQSQIWLRDRDRAELSFRLNPAESGRIGRQLARVWRASGESAILAGMTVWNDVDEPVLVWVAEERPAGTPSSQLQLTIRPDDGGPPPTFAHLDGLDERQVDDALMRLESYGLIARGAGASRRRAAVRRAFP